MKTILEVREAINHLPEEAATKPILSALADHLESFSSNPSLATMRQELDALKAAPSHTAGLCNRQECQPCRDAQSAVAHQTEDGIITLFDDAARHYGLESELSLLAEAVKRHRGEDAQWSPRQTVSNRPQPFIEIG